eukprot:scaffold677_cov118-Isochrysis_galbana.AAC.1
MSSHSRSSPVSPVPPASSPKHATVLSGVAHRNTSDIGASRGNRRSTDVPEGSTSRSVAVRGAPAGGSGANNEAALLLRSSRASARSRARSPACRAAAAAAASASRAAASSLANRRATSASAASRARSACNDSSYSRRNRSRSRSRSAAARCAAASPVRSCISSCTAHADKAIERPHTSHRTVSLSIATGPDIAAPVGYAPIAAPLRPPLDRGRAGRSSSESIRSMVMAPPRPDGPRRACPPARLAGAPARPPPRPAARPPSWLPLSPPLGPPKATPKPEKGWAGGGGGSSDGARRAHLAHLALPLAATAAAALAGCAAVPASGAPHVGNSSNASTPATVRRPVRATTKAAGWAASGQIRGAASPPFPDPREEIALLGALATAGVEAAALVWPFLDHRLHHRGLTMLLTRWCSPAGPPTTCTPWTARLAFAPAATAARGAADAGLGRLASAALARRPPRHRRAARDRLHAGMLVPIFGRSEVDPGLKTSRNTTPHTTNSQRSTIWVPQPGPKYQVMPGGEKGEVTMEGVMRSRYGGTTLQSGGIVCLIVVKFCIQIQQLGVESLSLWRGYEYERPTVQKPSQIAADVGGAHTITVEEVPELPSLRAACRIEALPQSPDLRHPPPRGASGSGTQTQPAPRKKNSRILE